MKDWTRIKSDETRQHRQSYRHADPRRQQQHPAVAERVTSNRDGFRNSVTFDLLTSGLMHAERLLQGYTCTKFCVNSSSRFTYRARINRHTDTTELYTHAGIYTAGVVNKTTATDWS